MRELLSAQLTHVGKVRRHNEDSVKSQPDLGVWVLADGMGGLERGEVASRVTVDNVIQAVREGRDLDQAVEDAHRAVAMRAGGDQQRMGSTVVALKVEANRRFKVVWVGDSRAYLWRGASGEFRQLTRDHSVAQRLADIGSIAQDQVAAHPRRNVLTQAVGLAEIEGIQVAQVRGELGGGECILLCSDGLSGEVDDERLKALLSQHRTPDAIAQALMEAALETGARDNISVLVVATPEDWPARRESLARAFPEPGLAGGTAETWTTPAWRWVLLAALVVVLLVVARFW